MDEKQAHASRQGKPVSASATVLATLVEPSPTPTRWATSTAVVIMKLADQAGAAAAIRHAGRSASRRASIDWIS